MTTADLSPERRVAALAAEAATDRAVAQELAKTFDESTGASWFWAFLFGPIYFAVHGFWGRAVLVLALNLVIIGFFVAPFLAYPAWRVRAEAQAEKLLAVEKLRRV